MDFPTLGSAIRAARKARRLSQTAVGAPLGMSRSTVSGIENGTIPEIGLRKVMALAAALGLELVLQPQAKRPTLQQLRQQRDEA